ncbi:GAP family protein [Nocardia sp. NPDC058633]|uniref:GAP family protein n=1 Tax=Nocardia sp. NPDC058633 TaxID=3346568 RepID=UPI00365CB722
MGSVIGGLLPLTVGVAISPVPIIAAILMILSKNAGGAAKGFAAGWVGGIVVVTGVMTKALGLGALLSGVNPKNLLLCVSAGVAIGAAGLSAGGELVAIVVFTLLASATVLAVVLGYMLAADRLGPTLDSLREWLQLNNHAVMAVVLLIMGAVVFGKGLGGL